MVKKFIFTVILCFTSALSFAQDVEVKAYTDTSDYLIGDHIKYTIQVTSGKDIAVLAAGFIDSIKGIDVPAIDDPVIEERGDQKFTIFRLTLSRFDSAQVTIPPIPVYYRVGKDDDQFKPSVISPGQLENDPTIQTAYSNPVSFAVHWMKVNTEEDIKDVKAPVTIPLDWKIVALWILAGLIILGILYYLYRKYIKKKEGLTGRRVVHVPSHIKALSALSELETRQLWQQGKVKEFHSEITEIIRKYFEERFNLPALELTTSEAMLHLRNTSGAENIINITYDFLSNADLVKFAKYTPMNTVNEEMMKQAYEIVNTTAPAEKQPEAAEA
ncbi:MAG: hypothetical protein R6W90_06155 [Ignavibacteriaceae bacterium]